jgi:hydroxymethylbilane synthase
VRTLRVGTRGSELALTQTRGMMAALAQRIPGLQIKVEIIRTKGDIVTNVPLAKIGDRGLFIKDIEDALLEDRIDFAVHSMKDVPSQIPSGLTLAATTERLDPRDALIGRDIDRLEDLPQNGTVATGSLRRRSQILALRPDLQVEDLRGNVTTRLRKFDESSWDAVILAGAGLERLELAHRISARIPTRIMLPAVGQGALALEARAEDRQVVEWLYELQHIETANAVVAERAFLGRLEGGCQVPIGALGTIQGNKLELEGFIGTTDGRRTMRRRGEASVAEAGELGLALAEEILAEGGREILEETRSA